MSIERTSSLRRSTTKKGDDVTKKQQRSMARTKTLIQLATAHGKATAMQDWRRDRDRINHRAALTSTLCAVFGLTGTMCAVVQHELILRGVDPLAFSVNVLKGCNSLFTLLCIGMLVRYYWLMTIFERLKLLLDRRASASDTQVSLCQVLANRWLWAEIVVCAVHLPPYVTFEASAYQNGNFILHRGESLDSAFGTIRLYLLGRVFQNLSLNDLPLRHSLTQSSDVHVGAKFAVKRMLGSWRATLAVAGIWVATLFVLGFLYRVGEITGCMLPLEAQDERCKPEVEQRSTLWSYDGVQFYDKVNDLYLQNAMWLMFVTGTTVGYGDTFPSTTWGRIIAAFSALVGLILTSLLTASLGNSLTFTPEEHTALTLMTREKYKMMMTRVAAKLLVAWWRVRQQKGKKGRRLAKLLDLQAFRQEFRRVKQVSKADIEECAADQMKLRQMLGTLRYIQQSLDKVEGALKRLGLEQRLGLLDLEAPSPLRAHARDTSGFSTRMLNSFKAQSPDAKRLQQAVASPLASPLGPAPSAVSTGGAARITSVSSSVYPALAPGEGSGVKAVVEAAASHQRRSTRTELAKKLQKSAQWAAVGGCAGAIAAIAQDELLFQNVRYDDWSIDILKGFNSLTSIFTAVVITRLHWQHLRHKEAETNLRLGQRKPKEGEFASVKGLCMRWMYWAELITCLAHLPPGVSFEWGNLQLDNYVVYRGETILALCNTLRMYLLLRVLKNYVLSDLPKQQTISSYTGIKIGYRFAIKRGVNVGSIGVSWVVSLLFLALWFRSAERSACLIYPTGSSHQGCVREDAQNWTLYGSPISQNYGTYFASAVWHVFVTSTTVGYGDIYPVTHVGRTVSAVAAVMGIIFVSLLTASLTSTIAWTPSESETMRVLESRRVKLKLAKKAVRFIQLWWRAKSMAGTAHAPRLYQDVARSMGEFQWARKEATILSLHDHSTSSHQISKAFLLVRELGDQLTELKSKIAEQPAPEMLVSQLERTEHTEEERAEIAEEETLVNSMIEEELADMRK